MTATLLSTLPGNIPGLLRRGSPITQQWSIDDGEPFTIKGVAVENVTEAGDPDTRWLCWFTDRRVGRDNRAALFLRLDLTDPTGRAHAAWWARRRGLCGGVHISNAMWAAIGRAEDGLDMTPEQIDTLARLVLRLAGRTP